MAGYCLYGVHVLKALFLGEIRLGRVYGSGQVPSKRVVWGWRRSRSDRIDKVEVPRTCPPRLA
jgi:hypothetical protein